MKLLHTADLHLGARFVSLGGKGEAQRRQLLATFERVIDLAVEEKVDAVLISGDLFDSTSPSAATLEKARLLLARLARDKIHAFIIPGTHDHLGPSSVWRVTPIGGDTIEVFTETGAVRVPDLDLTVHAFVAEGKTAGPGSLSNLRRTGESRIEIGMMHGSLAIPGLVEDDALLFTEREARETGLDYLALGHWHSFSRKEFGSVIGCYPGSPEMVATDQKGAGSVAIVTIGPEGTQVEQRTVGKRRFDSLQIDVGLLASASEVEQKILARADEDLVLEVTLSGLCSLNLGIEADKLAGELSDAFFVLKIKDASHPPLDDALLSGLSPHTVAGRFAEIMRERVEQADEEERDVCEEALRLGVALLEGRTVLE